MKDIVIYGVGGFGRGTLEILEAINYDKNTWNILGFVDDDTDKHATMVNGYPVLGGREWLGQQINTCIALCQGTPSIRYKLKSLLSENHAYHFPTLIHPFSCLAKRITVGEGTIIFPGVIIDTGTQIGSHILLSRSATIGHDVSIGDFSNLSPSATVAGECKIGIGNDVGSNATLIPFMQTGDWTTIGAGAVVTKQLPANVTAVGIPAKIISKPTSIV